mmetsp:Transcript_39144/g.117679  ORF Transcript_39144/g.117679 Transcript_39144/m.117679 type:complete len:274 (-) Transcript_39144:196-1017(-)
MAAPCAEEGQEEGVGRLGLPARRRGRRDHRSDSPLHLGRPLFSRIGEGVAPLLDGPRGGARPPADGRGGRRHAAPFGLLPGDEIAAGHFGDVDAAQLGRGRQWPRLGLGIGPRRGLRRQLRTHQRRGQFRRHHRRHRGGHLYHLHQRSGQGQRRGDRLRRGLRLRLLLLLRRWQLKLLRRRRRRMLLLMSIHLGRRLISLGEEQRVDVEFVVVPYGGVAGEALCGLARGSFDDGLRSLDAGNDSWMLLLLLLCEFLCPLRLRRPWRRKVGDGG